MRRLAIGALVLCCGAIALLMVRSEGEPVRMAAVPALETSAPKVGSEQDVTSRPVEPAPAPPPTSRAPPEPVERFPPPRTDDPHWRTAFAVFRSREDDVDACRDRYTPPPIADLVPRSRLIAAAIPGQRPVQEIDLHQIVLFEISTVKNGFWVDSAKVVETSLEFPAPDGSRRRATVDDAALNRCVESVLVGARLHSERIAPGERFRIDVLAGEAVYDIR